MTGSNSRFAFANVSSTSRIGSGQFLVNYSTSLPGYAAAAINATISSGGGVTNFDSRSVCQTAWTSDNQCYVQTSLVGSPPSDQDFSLTVSGT
jgi:hypothetical protein